MKYIFNLDEHPAFIESVILKSHIQIKQINKLILLFVDYNKARYTISNHTEYLNKFLAFALKLTNNHNANKIFDHLSDNFWPYINTHIEEDIYNNNRQDVHFYIEYDTNFVVEILDKPTKLDLVLKRVVVELEHELEAGRYVDPRLKEIYDACYNKYATKRLLS